MGASMHTLTVNVIWATALRREIARAAIGHVLLFLRKELPEAHIVEFIDQMPQALSAVDKAAGAGNGDGRSKEAILREKLENLGLNETQIIALLKEVIARAKTLLGSEDAAKITQVLSSVSPNRSAPSAQTTQPIPAPVPSPSRRSWG